LFKLVPGGGFNLKRIDRELKATKFDRVAPVHIAVWKWKTLMSGIYLSEPEIEAFLKGKYYATKPEQSIGLERSIMIALYQYYRQSDNIMHSVRKAEETTSLLFSRLGWSAYPDAKNDDVAQEIEKFQ
jgi:hypothetical protein